MRQRVALVATLARLYVGVVLIDRECECRGHRRRIVALSGHSAAVYRGHSNAAKWLRSAEGLINRKAPRFVYWLYDANHVAFYDAYQLYNGQALWVLPLPING